MDTADETAACEEKQLDDPKSHDKSSILLKCPCVISWLISASLVCVELAQGTKFAIVTESEDASCNDETEVS